MSKGKAGNTLWKFLKEAWDTNTIKNKRRAVGEKVDEVTKPIVGGVNKFDKRLDSIFAKKGKAKTPIKKRKPTPTKKRKPTPIKKTGKYKTSRTAQKPIKSKSRRTAPKRKTTRRS